MHIEHADPSVDKGWYSSLRRSNFAVVIGYANKGIDEPHEHTRITEIYLVARGTAEIRVERETIRLAAGDMLALEPGEAHTFLSSSPDYLHFVVHAAVPSNDAIGPDKIPVSRARLGL